MKILGIIPARFASTRFPGKPLIDIDGKPMIQRVYEQVKKVSIISDVVVATDDERIKNAVESFGGKAMMTSSNHQSGTDRCNEVVQKISEKYDVVVNIQGDEPFIHPQQIEKICSLFSSENIKIGTLVKKIKLNEELINPNVVKAVIGSNNKALYFSRAVIPYLRNISFEEWVDKNNFFKHIGIYAYRTNILKEITLLPQSKLELAESLEQLRWLENGYTIHALETEYESVAIDTPEDLKKL